MVRGPVVLIDEIDKADPSVPNGLLESLGNEGFNTPLLEEEVKLCSDTSAPLVMITTNEERDLPAAFLRRCLVLDMGFPPADQSVEDFLVARAGVHWNLKSEIEEAFLREEIVPAVMHARKAAGIAKPGAAEFLDLVRALVKLHKGDRSAQQHTFREIKNFALKKQPRG